MRLHASLLAMCLSLFIGPALADDATLLKTLAEGGRAEVEAGKLAADKGVSAGVRDFGVMMTKDHGAANKKVADLAKAKGVALPTELGQEKKEGLTKLRQTEGAGFDQEYMKQQVAAHEKTVKLLRAEIESGTSADTKALARELLPTVESHLKEAYRLTGQSDKATNLPTTGG
jgi:putative membrane protein